MATVVTSYLLNCERTFTKHDAGNSCDLCQGVYLVYMPTIVFDGAALAAERRGPLAERARALRSRRGRSPRLGLIAFREARNGRVLYVKRKEAAANGAGVELATCILAADARTEDVLGCVGRLDRQQLDGMFLQFPAPPTVEVERVIEMIPDRLDIDVTSPAAMRRYMTVPGSDPPATVAACLELLDAHGVSCRGLDGAVVAEPTPFALMLREAFVRRGVRMRRFVPPASRGMRNLLAECRLVVVSAGQPGIVSAGMLRSDTVAIDAGYFNEGGVGDIDASDGFEHLRAFAPVPGGIGPLTISLLIERVIERAEAALT